MLHVSARADTALSQANAPVQSHWSFQKPSEPAVPDVRDGAWPWSEVDRFLLAKLEAAGFAPLGQADKRTLIRRATYDLKSVVDPVHTHDFHATILHLLGLNHERLTYFHDGRDFRLTDVSGQVVNGVLA